MSGSERGGALPAALILQLILLLVGLQIALSASTLRLAVARTGARLQAEQLAAAAVAVAAQESGTTLAAALAGEDLALPDLAPLQQPRALTSLLVLDDDDGDGDAGLDSNGRIFLSASAAITPFPGTLPSRSAVVRELLLGAQVPLPGALVDCGAGLALCGGTSGCPVPPGSVDGQEAAALAVPEARVAVVDQALFELSREVLRGAHQRCAAATCGATDLPFLQAAATQVLRRLDLPESDATGLDAAGIALLVAGLLELSGTESGSGTFPWWDGTHRAVPDMSILPGAISALAAADGHVPSLTEHPYPLFLRGMTRRGSDAGLCRRLPALLAAAQERAAAVAAAGESAASGEMRVITAPLVLAAGELLSGRGLLVLRDAVTVAAGGRLEWQGSVVLDGGRLAGEGQVTIRGSLLVNPPAPAGAVDLATIRLQLVGDESGHRMAWESAGNVLLSAWYGSPGP